MAYRVWRERSKSLLRMGSTFLIAVCCTVLPYSIFASVTSGKLVLLSTQGGAVLLDGHNEEVLKTGRWGAKWRKAPDSDWARTAFYNRPGIKALSSKTVKVYRFYREHPEAIIPMLTRKYSAGFRSFSAYRIILVCLIGIALFYLVRTLPNIVRRIAVPGILVAAVYYGYYFLHHAGFLHPAAFLFISFASVLTAGFFTKEWKFGLSPVVMVLFGNFLLLTLLLFGYRRFTQVIDPVLMLQACYLIVFGTRLAVGEFTAAWAPIRVGTEPREK